MFTTWVVENTSCWQPYAGVDADVDSGANANDDDDADAVVDTNADTNADADAGSGCSAYPMGSPEPPKFTLLPCPRQ